jgi:plastocyanin domain-containing protein
MNKTVSIIIIIVLIAVLGFIFSSGTKPDNGVNRSLAKNTVIKEGVQYITIDAKGGYSPRLSQAQPGIPTKLIMKTSGTYDCSSAMTIPSLNIQKILPQSGDTEIDLGILKEGETLQGLCSMGMFNFEIKS